MAIHGRKSTWAGSLERCIYATLIGLGLLLCFSNGVLGQDKAKLRRGLTAPTAAERLEAAVAYADICTQEDLKKLLYGYQTKYWDKDHYVYSNWPADKQAFAEVIEHWPKCITKSFIDDLYKYKDDEPPTFQLEHTIAWALYQNAPNVDHETPVGLKVREYWLSGWRNTGVSRLNALVWTDIFRWVSKRRWLVELLYEEEALDWQATAVLAAFTGDYNSERLYRADENGQYGFTLKGTVALFPWVSTLIQCLNGGHPPFALDDVMVKPVSTALGYMAAVDLISILCDRPDWVTWYADELQQPIFIRRQIDWYNGRWYSEYESPTNEFLHHNGSLRYYIESAVLKIRDLPFAEMFDPHAILHHPWLAWFRAEEGFKEWWRSLFHSVDFVEPTPLFGAPND